MMEQRRAKHSHSHVGEISHVACNGAFFAFESWDTIDVDALLYFLVVDRKRPRCWDSSTDWGEVLTKQQFHAAFNINEVLAGMLQGFSSIHTQLRRWLDTEPLPVPFANMKPTKRARLVSETVQKLINGNVLPVLASMCRFHQVLIPHSQPSIGFDLIGILCLAGGDFKQRKTIVAGLLRAEPDFIVLVLNKMWGSLTLAVGATVFVENILELFIRGHLDAGCARMVRKGKLVAGVTRVLIEHPVMPQHQAVCAGSSPENPVKFCSRLLQTLILFFQSSKCHEELDDTLFWCAWHASVVTLQGIATDRADVMEDLRAPKVMSRIAAAAAAFSLLCILIRQGLSVGMASKEEYQVRLRAEEVVMSRAAGVIAVVGRSLSHHVLATQSYVNSITYAARDILKFAQHGAFESDDPLSNNTIRSFAEMLVSRDQLLDTSSYKCANPDCSALPCGNASRFQKCSGCSVPRYCSVGCRDEHWPVHKFACRYMCRKADRPTQAVPGPAAPHAESQEVARQEDLSVGSEGLLAEGTADVMVAEGRGSEHEGRCTSQISVDTPSRSQRPSSSVIAELVVSARALARSRCPCASRMRPAPDKDR